MDRFVDVKLLCTPNRRSGRTVPCRRLGDLRHQRGRSWRRAPGEGTAPPPDGPPPSLPPPSGTSRRRSGPPPPPPARHTGTSTGTRPHCRRSAKHYNNKTHLLQGSDVRQAGPPVLPDPGPAGPSPAGQRRDRRRGADVVSAPGVPEHRAHRGLRARPQGTGRRPGQHRTDSRSTGYGRVPHQRQTLQVT